MRQMQSMALMGFLATLVLTSASVLAVEVEVEVDKRIVAPGESITVTGTITDDDGNPGTFEYRAAAIVAKHRNGGERIIICDSEKQTTAADGKVSFECKIPTLAELEALGVQNAADRAVIPIKGGVSVRDPDTNESHREHGKALIVNTEKFKGKFDDALARLDSFIEKAQGLMARCDNITARAEEAGAEHVVDRCSNFQKKLQEQIDKAVAAQDRINSAIGNLGNLSGTNFDDLEHGLVNFRDGARDFKVDVKDLREFVDKSRADLEKRVAKEIVEKTRERTKEIREGLKEKRMMAEEKVKEVRARVMERKEGKLAARPAEPVRPAETVSTGSGSESESSSGSGESTGSGSSGSGG